MAVDCCQSSNPDFYGDDRKTHQLDFDGTWQWGRSTGDIYPERARVYILPLYPSPNCLGLSVPALLPHRGDIKGALWLFAFRFLFFSRLQY